MATERYTVTLEIQVPVDAESFNEAGDKVAAVVINSGRLLSMRGKIIGMEIYLGDFGEEIPGVDDTPGGD